MNEAFRTEGDVLLYPLQDIRSKDSTTSVPVQVYYSVTELLNVCMCSGTSGVPRNFVRGGGVQQIQLRTEDRENGDLGAVAP